MITKGCIMTLTQLKYTVAVSRSGSISKAAEELFVSQSVISTAIKTLEEEINQKLFIRTTKGISLTPFGKTFVSYTSSILTQFDQLEGLVNLNNNKEPRTVSVASTGYFFLGYVLADVFEKYKQIGIKIVQFDEDEDNVILDLVYGKTVEFGILRIWDCYKKIILNQIKVRKLKYETIATLEMAATVGPNSPLYTKVGDEVTVEELCRYPVVSLYSLDKGPYSDIYDRIGLNINPSKIVTNSRSTIYEVLDRTDCFYLNSAYPFEILNNQLGMQFFNYRTFKIKDCKIHPEIGWISRSNESVSSVVEEIIEHIAKFFV